MDGRPAIYFMGTELSKSEISVLKSIETTIRSFKKGEEGIRVPSFSENTILNLNKKLIILDVDNLGFKVKLTIQGHALVQAIREAEATGNIMSGR